MRIEVDYGGTWTRIFLDPIGNQRRPLKIPSPPLKRLPTILKKSLQKWGSFPAENLLVGAKGVWTKKKKRDLWKRLKELAENVEVLSDIEFAYNSTFKDKPGILLIAGTGSIAYGKDGCGHWSRAGGLGPKRGDEGSGYWIGKQFLERTKRNFRSKSVREIASLAPIVLGKAKRKDPLATQIVREAHAHLNRILQETKSHLHLRRDFILACRGGLLQNPFFRAGFSRYVNNKLKYGSRNKSH
ncbi:MAG: hypothetical protein HYY63_02735 [Elusimicrobia bacterium]|nr:hypothetical protein [Elusimicrobiota bacterium]